MLSIVFIYIGAIFSLVYCTASKYYWISFTKKFYGILFGLSNIWTICFWLWNLNFILHDLSCRLKPSCHVIRQIELESEDWLLVFLVCFCFVIYSTVNICSPFFDYDILIILRSHQSKKNVMYNKNCDPNYREFNIPWIVSHLSTAKRRTRNSFSLHIFVLIQFTFF